MITFLIRSINCSIRLVSQWIKSRLPSTYEGVHSATSTEEIPKRGIVDIQRDHVRETGLEIILRYFITQLHGYVGKGTDRSLDRYFHIARIGV